MISLHKKQERQVQEIIDNAIKFVEIKFHEWKISFQQYNREGACNPYLKTIHIDIDKIIDAYSSPMNFYKENFDNIQSAISHVIWHEIGHAAHFEVLRKKGGISVINEEFMIYENERKTLEIKYKNKPLLCDKKILARFMTDYLTTIRLERIAERFATRMTGIKSRYMCASKKEIYGEMYDDCLIDF